jgi:hypothetical protein
MLKTTLLFIVTALAEIVGCFLPYVWLRKGGQRDYSTSSDKRLFRTRYRSSKTVQKPFKPASDFRRAALLFLQLAAIVFTLGFDLVGWAVKGTAEKWHGPIFLLRIKEELGNRAVYARTMVEIFRPHASKKAEEFFHTFARLQFFKLRNNYIAVEFYHGNGNGQVHAYDENPNFCFEHIKATFFKDKVHLVNTIQGF